MKRILGAFALSLLYALNTSVPAGATSHSALLAAAPAALADGEVRKIDKDAQKLTIRHGPLENLGMPGMTMVFRVSEPAMLDAVKTGDKVKFSAEKIGGGYAVTHLERAQ